MMTVLLPFPLNGKLFRAPAGPPKPGVTATDHNTELLKPALLHFHGGSFRRRLKEVCK